MPLLAYSSDLHGNVSFYQEFLLLARAAGAQAALLGGDLLPHTSARQLAIQQQRRFIHEQLAPLLRQHQQAGGPPVYAILGNDDWQAAGSALDELESAGLLRQLHMRALALGHYFLAGYACVPLTPFSIKDWERPEDAGVPAFSFEHALQSCGEEIRSLAAQEFQQRPTIGQELLQLAGQSDPARTIYICHTPPYGTGLDRTRLGRAVGSRDLRQFIERVQPPLTLHGHIHEAPEVSGRYATRLGSSWCVNPGQGSQLHAIICDPGDLPGSLQHSLLGPWQP